MCCGRGLHVNLRSQFAMFNYSFSIDCLLLITFKFQMKVKLKTFLCSLFFSLLFYANRPSHNSFTTWSVVSTQNVKKGKKNNIVFWTLKPDFVSIQDSLNTKKKLTVILWILRNALQRYRRGSYIKIITMLVFMKDFNGTRAGAK